MGRITEIDHTADVGLRVEAADLADLYGTAACGMFALIGAAEFAAGERRSIAVEARGESPAERLRDLLRKLLAAFDRESFFAVEVGVVNGPERVLATAIGGTFDPARHEFRSELKGVTWHGLAVELTADGWRAEIVFDV